MKTAITIASLALTAPALAEPRAMDQFENMWAAYTNWCATVVNDTETFYQNLDFLSAGHAISLTPSSNGDVIDLKILRDVFLFSLHVGHVGGRTFMSCGVTSDNLSLEESVLVNIVENTLPNKLTDGELVGGSGMVTEMFRQNGQIQGGDPYEAHHYFVDGAVPGLDTVTFIQVSGGWYSIYFHHVFEGRVGLPASTPAAIKRIP